MSAGPLDIRGACAKLKRAKVHIKVLFDAIDRQGLMKAEGTSPHVNAFAIPLRREFSPNQGAVVSRIDRVIEVGEDWPLLVGDAVHNLRCSLDHLAWQLAIRHYGVAPTDPKIIKQIQFPVVVEEAKWPAHVHRKHMSDVDAEKLKKFQPFNLGPISRAGGALHPLEGLAGFNGLDNIDKHRTINVTSVVQDQAALSRMPPTFRDCVPTAGAGANGFSITYSAASQPPRVGDEILRVYVVKTGPNPDVNFDPGFACYVAIRETWDVRNALETFTEFVTTILGQFAVVEGAN